VSLIEKAVKYIDLNKIWVYCNQWTEQYTPNGNCIHFYFNYLKLYDHEMILFNDQSKHFFKYFCLCTKFYTLFTGTADKNRIIQTSY